MPNRPLLSAHSTQSVPAVITPQASLPEVAHPGLMLWLRASVLVALLLLLPNLAAFLLPPLPGYAMTLNVDGSCWLCGPEQTTPQTVNPDVPIDLQVRPLSPVWGPTFLHLYVRHRAHLRRVFAFAAHEPDGTLHLRGLARDVLDLRGSERGSIEIFARVSRSPIPLSPLSWSGALPQGDGGPLPHLSLRLQAP